MPGLPGDYLICPGCPVHSGPFPRYSMNFAGQRLLKSANLGSVSLSVASGAVLLSSGSAQAKEKLPIYPRPDQEILLQEVPSELEKQIGVARRHLTTTYRDAYRQVQGLVDRWIGVERAIENRIQLIISPEESLTPPILYIGVSTLTGSILTRSRSLPLRIIFPPLFLALSSAHFLPKTTSNLTTYIGSLEDTYLPSLAGKHDVAKAHSQMTWETMKDVVQGTRSRVEAGVLRGVGKVQEATGLKVAEMWKEEVVETAKSIEEKVVQGAKVVEKKVEESGADTVEENTDTKMVKRLV